MITLIQTSIQIHNVLHIDDISHNFQGSIKQGYTLVAFQVPWCGHCKKLYPILADISQITEFKQKVKIFEVNCVVSGEICYQEGIDSYPTLMLYKDGLLVNEYTGLRDKQKILSWLAKQLN
ncbi:Protein_disulfide isomerase PDI3 [Hexamita inflata]|uniref:Protein disulfide isomerase PDI3 n=1 Tax=Hexamita inflata TaxID=28002 RepID=A0AA86NQJ3_9EUKA|nr:Protein disulfide isomerase PDI3 [Hexamita inflata]CAI9935760.1 Protein disulfide isomerase PDI3 [Hexamita inflata]